MSNNHLDEIGNATLNMNQANSAANQLDGIVPNPKARLREQVREVMRFCH